MKKTILVIGAFAITSAMAAQFNITYDENMLIPHNDTLKDVNDMADSNDMATMSNEFYDAISLNVDNIAANNTAIDLNADDIDANEVDIANNSSAILSNDADIAANTDDISSNDADIALNVSDIGVVSNLAVAAVVNNSGMATNLSVFNQISLVTTNENGDMVTYGTWSTDYGLNVLGAGVISTANDVTANWGSASLTDAVSRVAILESDYVSNDSGIASNLFVFNQVSLVSTNENGDAITVGTWGADFGLRTLDISTYSGASLADVNSRVGDLEASTTYPVIGPIDIKIGEESVIDFVTFFGGGESTVEGQYEVAPSNTHSTGTALDYKHMSHPVWETASFFFYSNSYHYVLNQDGDGYRSPEIGYPDVIPLSDWEVVGAASLPVPNIAVNYKSVPVYATNFEVKASTNNFEDVHWWFNSRGILSGSSWGSSVIADTDANLYYTLQSGDSPEEGRDSFLKSVSVDFGDIYSNSVPSSVMLYPSTQVGSFGGGREDISAWMNKGNATNIQWRIAYHDENGVVENDLGFTVWHMAECDEWLNAQK